MKKIVFILLVLLIGCGKKTKLEIRHNIYEETKYDRGRRYSIATGNYIIKSCIYNRISDGGFLVGSRWEIIYKLKPFTAKTHMECEIQKISNHQILLPIYSNYLKLLKDR